MRLTAIIILSACLTASAGVHSQTLTLSARNVPLTKVFGIIESQTDYVFFYNYDLLKDAKNVTIEVKNASLQDVLQKIFADQPLDYSIKQKTIVITKKKMTEYEGYKLQDEGLSLPLDIGGRIINAQSEPLVGATVTLKRTGKSEIADANGRFIIKNITADDVFDISYTGYKTLNIKVGDIKSFIFVLQIADNDLDKVIVRGYGKTSQRLSTGDMAVVTAEEIEKQPVINPLLALQGRVAGLDIQQTSGYGSAPIKATIRGLSSVNPDQVSDPLYIVDGVPLTVLNIGKAQNWYSGSYGFLQNAGLIGPANGQSPLFSINPSDIESITVLKDADATSIYGSRGANGVILITTKSGKPGKTSLDIHMDMGVNKVTRFWKMLNTQQYVEMRREAITNDGYGQFIGDPAYDQYWPDLTIWDTTRYIDWQRAMYGRAGKVINAQMSLSGGNVQTTFRISTSYSHSTAITTASGADQRASVATSITHHSVNRRFSVTLTNSYSYTKSDMIQMPARVSYAPNAPAIFDSSGKLNWKEWNEAFGRTNSNPFSTLLCPYTAKTQFLNSNLVVSFQPFRGLTFSTSFGYNNAQANQIALIPIASQDPATQPTGSASFGNNRNTNWIIEPQLNYSTAIGPGNLDVLIGASLQNTVTNGIFASGSGYNNDALLRTISNATNQFSRDNYGEYRYAAVFARLGYNIANKYLFSLNARRDGSSNYGPGNEFGNFASIGAAWIFTEEGLVKKNLRFLSFGKLQASYGTTGSDGGRPYGYITRWTSNSLLLYDGVRPVIPTQHANPNYHWQLNRKFEVSVSLGFFKDWLTIRTSFYRNRTNNQLLDYPTPMLSGFGSVIANLPALVQNQGWEFTFGGKGIHTKFFNWSPSINFAINSNKFISFPGLGSSPYRNSIGQSLNGIFLLHYTGVDPQTGEYTFEDRDHDGVVSSHPRDGDVYFKKLSPSIATGFGFNFDLRGFNLALFFTAKKQEGVNAIAQGDRPGHVNTNQPIEVLDRWRKPGDITRVGKFSMLGAMDPNGFLYSSDIGYTDASYIRLSNLSLTYKFPGAWVRKAGMQSCNVYVHASNVFVLTKYKGIDPETQNFGGLPPTRTIVAGLSVNL